MQSLSLLTLGILFNPFCSAELKATEPRKTRLACQGHTLMALKLARSALLRSAVLGNLPHNSKELQEPYGAPHPESPRQWCEGKSCLQDVTVGQCILQCEGASTQLWTH